MAIVAAVAAVALLAPWISPYDPLAQDQAPALQPPSRAHWMGTDPLGRDIFSRVLHGARLTVPVGVAVVALALVAGMLVGSAAGFLGGWADEILMRFTDLFLAFPALILAMAMAGALGPGLAHALLALALAWWPPYARLVRGQVLSLRESPFVEAARCLGASPWRLLFRHILPNCLTPLVVQATLDLGGVILAAAGLSFIGLGAQPPSPEWGAMVAEGRQYIASQWWVLLFPGLAILITVTGFNLLGDGLRDALDPRRAG
jgi:peptide/nickel transport system permease protein